MEVLVETMEGLQAFIQNPLAYLVVLLSSLYVYAFDPDDMGGAFVSAGTFRLHADDYAFSFEKRWMVNDAYRRLVFIRVNVWQLIASVLSASFMPVVFLAVSSTVAVISIGLSQSGGGVSPIGDSGRFLTDVEAIGLGWGLILTIVLATRLVATWFRQLIV